MTWCDKGDVLSLIDNQLESDSLSEIVRVAAFDLDDTLCVYKKGKQYASTFVTVDESLPDKIADLVNNGYIIVVFTNQSGMSGDKFPLSEWKKKIKKVYDEMFKKVSDPIYFALYAAKKYDLYRKPNVGMWRMMKKDLNTAFGKKQISTKSFFVGDSAGRTQPSRLIRRCHPLGKKDRSDVDRKFALNTKLPFLTPDEFYLGEDDTPFLISGFNPAAYIESIQDNPPEYEFVPRKKELIVMVGYAGSGKSTFVKKNILPHKYVYVNRDEIGSMPKCVRMAETLFKKGKSVVIDNTGLDVMSRMQFTSLAEKHGYAHIRCIMLETSSAMSNHMNNVRHVYSEGKIPRVPPLVYKMFCQKLIEPNDKEFFDEIERVPFPFEPERLSDPKWASAFLKLSED